MGVMACSRSSCTNIMCTRYNPQYGYICDECFDELVNSGPQSDITEFMNTPKRPKNIQASRARFEIEFPEILY